MSERIDFRPEREKKAEQDQKIRSVGKRKEGVITGTTRIAEEEAFKGGVKDIKEFSKKRTPERIEDVLSIYCVDDTKKQPNDNKWDRCTVVTPNKEWRVKDVKSIMTEEQLAKRIMSDDMTFFIEFPSDDVATMFVTSQAITDLNPKALRQAPKLPVDVRQRLKERQKENTLFISSGAILNRPKPTGIQTIQQASTTLVEPKKPFLENFPNEQAFIKAFDQFTIDHAKFKQETAKIEREAAIERLRKRGLIP